MSLRQIAWNMFLVGAGLSVSVKADTIFALDTIPSGGTIQGQPGQTVGWGYVMTNQDNTGTFWLSADTISTTGTFVFGTPDSSIFNHPIVAPGASAQLNFVPNQAGLFQFTWDANAPPGTNNSGDFLLDVTWYTGDPRLCNFACSVANPTQTEAQTPYSVTAVAIGPPTLTKAFGSSSIMAGTATTLTFTITNPAANAVTLTGIAFTDTLPSGLIIATPNGLTGACGGGTITATAGSGVITLSGASLPTNATCSFSVNVIATMAGPYPNMSSAITSTNGATGLAASATLAVTPMGAFQVHYASNLNIGDSVVNMTNTGASNGNLCVNAYVFDQSEELLACCSCFVTPNGLQSASVKRSLIANNLTPEIPNSVVIKLLATTGPVGASGATGGVNGCNAGGAITFASLAGGMRAWGTSLHATPTAAASYGVTETPFSNSDLNQAELNHLVSFCAFIQSNASGFGICKGCSTGGLGAAAQP